MAKSTQKTWERKRALALRLDASRAAISTESRELRERLSPVRAAKAFTRSHPLSALGSLAAVTALATLRFRSRRRRRRAQKAIIREQELLKPKKSLVRRLFGWLFSLLIPAGRILILKLAKEYWETKHVAPARDSLLGP